MTTRHSGNKWIPLRNGGGKSVVHRQCWACCKDKSATSAKFDIYRLKRNWVFAMLVTVIGSINYTCVVSTSHQFITNPKSSTLDMTDKQIEPGLQLSENFYSLTYSVMFAGHTVSAIACGLTFNFVPTWYLFLTAILSHTVSYILYALAVDGWTMLLSRAMSGVAVGITVASTFAYFGVSFEKYVEDLKELDKFDKKRVTRVKGFVFSLFNIGNALGYVIGGGFPIILAQFPNTPQFQPPAWFCVGVGVALLLLQFALFHGECTWHCNKDTCDKWPLKLPSFVQKKDKNRKKFFCKIFIPVFIIVVGGVKGIRYLIPIEMMSPIVSDSFGYSEQDSSYLSILFFVGSFMGLILTYVLMCFKISSYGLTVTGLSCTIIAFVIMTDWQAIGSDPCTAYSLFHHPQLANYYRLQVIDSNNSSNLLAQSQDNHYTWCSKDLKSSHVTSRSFATCVPVSSCASRSDHSKAEFQVIFHVYSNKPRDDVCFSQIQTYQSRDKVTEHIARTDTDTIVCTSGTASVSSCFVLDNMRRNTSSTSSLVDESLVAKVHVQSLEVVEWAVYQMAVNRCEAASSYCHWIPNSQVTNKHCSDCQPICRDTRRTLNIVQFAIGLTFMFSTLTLLYTGAFLLLSDCVSTKYQALSMASLVAVTGFTKIVSSLWMDALYEKAGKRTYLLMLALVSLFLPLLVGILLLYPCIRERVEQNQKQLEEEGEDIELLPQLKMNYFRDSDD